MIDALTRRLSRLDAATEAITLWAIGFASIALGMLVSPVFAKGVATVGFLYLPVLAMKRRNETHGDYGLTLSRWREDLKLVGLLIALTIPLYGAAYVGFPYLLQTLPDWLSRHLLPYVGLPRFRPRLPVDFGLRVVDELLVVALPEEFFYRGYLQTRLRDAWPRGRVVFGVRLGRAFFLTAVLFALGHLAIFQVWRLSVFFPALLFGALRERTGTLFGATLFHAFCNLFEQTLRASFFGGR